MIQGVNDTSIFIAAERGRDINQELLPNIAYLTVITLAELKVGLLNAPNPELAARRLDTLTALSLLDALPVTDSVASKWAVMAANLNRAKRKININDLWIAAIALDNGLPVFSRDGDYDVIAEYGGPESIRV